MTSQRTSDDFDRLLTAWFDADAQVREPEDLLETVLERTARARRRPAWLLPERWIPMQLTMPFRTAPRLAPTLLLILVLLLAAVIAVVAVGSAKRLPAPFGPAANGQLAYVSAGQIFTSNADGSGAQPITSGERAAATPIWSRDGKRIAYKLIGASSPTDNPTLYGDLVVVNADGSNPIVLDANTTGMTATEWSLDGRFVLYSRVEGKLDQIFVAASDGSARPVRVGDAATPNWSPRWSPNGKSIAYLVDGDAAPKGSVGVWLMDIDGSNARKLTKETYTGFNSITWNHSGTQLAFTGSQGSNLDLWIVGLDGAPERAVTTNHGGASGASWSPDGSSLAYLVAANEFGTVAKIVVARGDGSDPHQLDGVFGWPDPQWSPDSTRLAAVGAGATDLSIYLLDPAGVAERIVIETALPSISAAAAFDMASWQRLAP
jgi:Tol biopolymer transport system component